MCKCNTVAEAQVCKGVFDDIMAFNEIGGFEFTKRGTDHKDVVQQMNFITEEYRELNEAFNTGDRANIAKEASDLIVVACGLLYRLGIDPYAAMYEVNESNMSKFCYTEEEAQASVDYFSNSDRYEAVHYEKKTLQNGTVVYVIYGTPKGGASKKIIKGVNYAEADLDGIA